MDNVLDPGHWLAGHVEPERHRFRSLWLAAAVVFLILAGVRLVFAIGEARDAEVAHRLAEVGVATTATRCEYSASNGGPDVIRATYDVGGTPTTSPLRHARLDALYGDASELPDGAHEIPPGSAYACPLALLVDPSDPAIVAAQHDVLYVAGGTEQSWTTQDVLWFSLIALTCLGMFHLTQRARAAVGRRPAAGRASLGLGAATLGTGVSVFMTLGAGMELVEDQRPIDVAVHLDERGATAVASSCRVLVRDEVAYEVFVTFDAAGENEVAPLADRQEIRGDGWDDLALPDGLHESPAGSIYPCPLEIRYDPDDPGLAMAQKDIVYFVERDEQRWNVGVLLGWSTATLAAAALWVMWWPPGPRRFEAS